MMRRHEVIRGRRGERGAGGAACFWRRIANGAALAGAMAVGMPNQGYAQVAYTVFPATPHASPDQTSDQPTGRGAARVTLTVRDSTLAYVVRELVHQAHLRVFFKESDPLFAQRVTVHVTHASLTDALTSVLRGTGLVAATASDGETVVIRPQVSGGGQNAVRSSAAGVVAGRVVDSASNKGIGGATVTISGTTLRTTTAESGQFALRDVPAGEQLLRVRAFGYKAATERVTVTDSERTTIQVVLRPSPTVLSGVVTTATGVQERRQVGNDITVLNADSIQRIAPVSTLTDMLETRVPGLTVLRESGIPGAPRRVRLRGTSSIERSNDPIMIVDGIRVNADQSGAQTMIGGSSIGSGSFAGPSPLDQIDPNSIETIEVFKGPSASAMYGADAANGVIVITTKRGRPGATRWDLALDAGRSTLPSGGYPVNVFRFGHSFPGTSFFATRPSHICLPVDVASPGFNNQSTCVLDSLVRYQALNDPRFNVFSHGPTRDASLTVRGGSGALTYSLTGSASNQQGIFQLPAIEANLFQQQHGFSAPEWMRHPDHLNTWGGTSTMDFLFSPGGGSVALTTSYLSSAQQQSTLQGAIQNLLGRYVDTANLMNPVIPDYYTRALLSTGTLTQAVTLNWPVKSWLPLHATAGLNVSTHDNRSVEPQGYNLADTIGRYSLAQGQSVQQTLNGGTTVLVPRRGGMPAVQIPIGFNWTAQQAQQFGVSTQNLPPGVLDPTVLPLAQGVAPTQRRANITTFGWYVSPTLDMGHGLYWSPGMRFDGASTAGQNAGLSAFPKLDFSWVAINQPEQPVLGAITLLRPRVAFGIAGEQPDPTSQYRLATYQEATLPNGASEQVLLLGSYGNTKLKPERSRELEGGFDTELWNQRVTLTFTGYHKLRYDAIVTSPLAPSIGVPVGFNTGTGTIGGDGTTGSYAYNVGTVRNTGVEATVGARLLDGRAVLWQVNANISKNHEMLLTLAPGLVPATEGAGSVGFRLVPGYPLDGLWAQPIAGYIDANQNGRIDPGEVRLAENPVYLGAPEPNYQLTGSTTLSLFNGRLSVNTAVDYQHGLTQTYNAAATSSVDGTLGGDYNAFTSALNDPATPLSQQAAIIGALACAPGGSLCTPYGLVQTVNTLRWQSLSVNYQVPTAFAQRWAHVTALSIALQGSNLGLHTNYRGKDPNIGFSPGSNGIADNGQLPQPRLWQLRVTLGH